jgi:endonuclease G
MVIATLFLLDSLGIHEGELMNSRTICSAVFLAGLLVFSTAFAKIEAVIGDVPLDKNPNVIGDVTTDNSSEVIISRDQYVISYNRARRSLNWVAWKVEANQLGLTGRTNVFTQDSDLQKYLTEQSSTERAVDPTEYQGSCFDRGHQAPSADRTDNVRDNEATFIMSNMIPQTPFLNRVVWEHLEQHTRDLVRKGKKTYIIAGPIYDKDYGSIGPNHDIPVPSKNFKIVVVLDGNKTIQDINKTTPIISVIMPNVLEDGSAPTVHAKLCSYQDPISRGDENDWEQYKTTVSQIQKLSGVSIPSLQTLDLEN